MTESKGLHRLSFSQREGKASLPEPMRLQHLPADFRNLVWYAVDMAIEQDRAPSTSRYSGTASMRTIIVDYFVRIHHETHDFCRHLPAEHKGLLKEIILEDRYDQVLTLVEFLLCHGLGDEQMRNSLLGAFTAVPIAYSVEAVDDLPTVVARASAESGAATQRAIGAIEKRGPAGAKAHLRKAAKAINEQRYEDAVRESIHAVESVARTIDPKGEKDLSHALRSLEREGVLKHKALRDAIMKIYGYTSDEEGIRHPLLDQGKAAVDLDDAVFMFSACAAFAAYMVNRSEQIGVREQ